MNLRSGAEGEEWHKVDRNIDEESSDKSSEKFL